MNFGYFDDDNKEYVIDKANTPAPWANYLGSPEYGAIISNNAGGYSFAKSGADGRIIKYIFDGSDKPGRYIYIKDEETKEYWSASWQPVAKDMTKAKYECRHGLGYTKLSCDYQGIRSEATYYVPMGAEYEVWCLELTNNSDRTRKISATGYAEFTNNKNYAEDQVNLQYALFITRTEFKKNKINQYIHSNLDKIAAAGRKIDNKTVETRFLGLAGAEVNGYCGCKDEFIGRYHDYSNPVGVENDSMPNTLNYNEYSCGALKSVLELQPGESKYVAFILGMKDDAESDAILSKYTSPKEICAKEVSELKSDWSNKLSAFTVKTPDENFNSMINIWNAYNCYMTFTWSRAASFIYCGLRNGYGYRDTVQDIQGVIHLSPKMAKDKIIFMLSAQVNHGGGLPLVKFTHNPGHEDTPEDASYVQETGHPAYRADDALWLFPTVYKYISETGDTAFLDEVIPYANKDEDTVYDHLKKAIDFSLNHLGIHGMPAGLHADWNDCLRLGADGESVFVAFQLYYAYELMMELAEFKNDVKYLGMLEYRKNQLAAVLDEKCFDKDRFIRGYTENGDKIGAASDKEANLWLNPQSWSVISRYAKDEKADLVLGSVAGRLNTDYGVKLMDPPYHEHAFDGAFAVIYNPGTKENAGIFSQSQGWIILAEALRGHGDQAFKYYKENSPAEQNNVAEIRKLEPYCYGQFTEGPDSAYFGRSQVHWLTGTASTMMVGCVEGILGMRPDLGGLKIAPSIPSTWDEVKIDKVFRGKKLNITIKNPDHKESGFKSLTVNGVNIDSNYIKEDILNDTNDIVLIF